MSDKKHYFAEQQYRNPVVALSRVPYTVTSISDPRSLNADPNPAFLANVNPDPDFQTNADPDASTGTTMINLFKVK
jgi:hypothetical protein